VETLSHLNSRLQHQKCAWERVAPPIAMSKESLQPAKAVTSPVVSTIDSVLAVSATTSLGTTRITKRSTRDAYPVADFVGRCFLRACYWFDVCTSWAKRYNPPVFTPVGGKAQAAGVTASSATMAAPVFPVQSTAATRTQDKT
jgi:hypothetical protein